MLRPILVWVLVVIIVLSVVAMLASLVNGDGHTFWSAVRTLAITTVTATVIRLSYTATTATFRPSATRPRAETTRSCGRAS